MAINQAQNSFNHFNSNALVATCAESSLSVTHFTLATHNFRVRSAIFDSGCKDFLSSRTTVTNPHSSLNIMGFNGSESGTTQTQGTSELCMCLYATDLEGAPAVIKLLQAHRVDIPQDLILISKLILTGCKFRDESANNISRLLPHGAPILVRLGNGNLLYLDTIIEDMPI